MNVTSGKKMKPLAILAYAEKGLGKTKFGTEAPKPVFVGAEENDEIDSARLDKIETWTQLIEQLKWVRDGKHEFKSLVLDGMDLLEDVAQKSILVGKDKDKTMATALGGFGKAYEKMSDMFLEMRDEYLVPIRDRRGMNVIILAHAEKTKHEDPMTNTSYDTYSTSIHKSIKPIFEDWVSAIFFIQWELFKATNNNEKEYAVGDGARVIYTEQRPSHVAKNRFNLPYEISYDEEGTFKKIGALIKEYFGSAPKFVAPAKEEVKNQEEIPTTETAASVATDSPSIENTAQETAVADKTPSISDIKADLDPEKANADKHELIQAQKAVDEIFAKLPADAKPSIQVAIERAVHAKDVTELRRLWKKINNIIKA